MITIIEVEKNSSSTKLFAIGIIVYYFLCLNHCYILLLCYYFLGLDYSFPFVLGGSFIQDLLSWWRSIVVILSHIACGFSGVFCFFFVLVWLFVCWRDVVIIHCLMNFFRLWIFVKWMKDSSPSLWCSSNNNNSWWIWHVTLYSKNCRFVFLFPRRMSCYSQPIVCLLQKLDRSFQILCFCIYNNSTFQFFICSKFVTCIPKFKIPCSHW